MSERGFVITENLRESDNATKDQRILNNLGGEGTAGNFELFSGNLRNVSTIPSGSYTYSGGFYNTDTDDGYVAFSNRTTVNLVRDGAVVATGTVTLSDGISKFQILNDDQNPIAPGSPNADLVRSDAVTTENIINLRPIRLETIADSGAENGNFLATEGQSEQDILNTRTIAQSYDIIDSALSIYYFKKSRLPLSYEDNIFTQNVFTDGYIRIVNDDNVPRGPTSPGLFIVQDGIAERAFEGEDNPWSEVGSTLVTSANAAVNTLTATNPVLTSIVTVAEANNVTRASHKIPVEILDASGNPEIYYLLLTT